MGGDLFVLALGIAGLLWGFAGTRFTRVVLVVARRIAGYAAIAGMLYMAGLGDDIRRAAGVAAICLHDGTAVICDLLLRAFAVHLPPGAP
jgi:hypothetical protein